MSAQQREQPIPAPISIKSLPWILLGVQVVCVLGAGLYLAWLGPSVSVYIFRMGLLLAILTLLQGLLGVLFLTKRGWLGVRIRASLQQVPGYSSQRGLNYFPLGCGMAILVGTLLVLVTVVFTILQIHSANFSFFFNQGGLALVATGMAQGIGWLLNLRSISLNDEKAHFLPRLKHFSKIWTGLLFFWLIGGILTLAFNSFYIGVLVITIGFFGIGYLSSMNLQRLYSRATG